MTPHEPSPSLSRAVLLGVSQYDNARQFSNIPSARANVHELRKALTSTTLGGMIPRTVETVRSDHCTRQRAMDALRTAIAQAQDLLFVYFSGHGYLHQEEDRPPALHLMFRDSTKNGAHLNAIPYEGLLKDLAGARAERVVLVLDCCFSGTAGKIPLPAGRPMTLITSAKRLERIGKGDGIKPTPFTKALIRVLSEGAATDAPVTVTALGKRLTALSAGQEVPGNAEYDRWVPGEWSSGGAGDTVLSQARLGGRAVPRWLSRLADAQLQLKRVAAYVPFSLTWLFGPGQPVWHRVTGGCAALALVAGAGTGIRMLNRPEPLCPAPLELRVLTSPETRAAMTSVLDTFQQSADATEPIGHRPQGCGQINTTVYSAPANKVIDAFRHSAAWAEPENTCTSADTDTSPCDSPLRDVGPHPDVWIPASSVTYDRVRDDTRKPESALELGLPRTLASSPAVLAATRDIPKVSQSGRTLADLVKAARAAGLSVRNAAPRSSEAALALLLRLPAGAGQQGGVLPEDDRTLACEAHDSLLKSPTQQVALLVAESTAAALDAPALDSRPSCLVGFGDSYSAYYPSDVPPLDLTYVPVTWETGRADRADRDAAVARLGAWLGSKDGLKALAGQGFRTPGGARGGGRDAPLNSSASFADHPRTGGTAASVRRINTLLDSYTGSGGTRRDVVFVVDVSSSSYSGTDAAVIRSVLTRAAGSLAGQDRYAITTVPGDTLLRLDTHSGAELAGAVGRLRPVQRNAGIVAAVRQAAKSLAAAPADTAGSGTPLLVLITDDEDSPDHADPTAPQTAVPVVVVSLEDAGCALAFNQALKDRGGACLDVGQDLPTGLADTIAQLTASRS